MSPHSEQITKLLLQSRRGDSAARDKLLTFVYRDLYRLAASHLRSERPDHTLQPTALVNELYLRLFAAGTPIDWQNRAHFFGVAAQTLRRILVDYARAGHAKKRGGGQVKVSLTHAQGKVESRNEDVLLVDEALCRLEQLDARAAKVVTLRFFGGLQEQDIAEALGISEITVRRDWRFARAWLAAQLGGTEPEKESGGYAGPDQFQ